MKVVLGATPDSWVASLQTALEKSGAEVRCYGNGAELNAEEGLILLYSRPEHVIEVAVSAGAEIEPAIEEWTQAARDFLNLFRHNRGKVMLVHGPSVLTAPQEFDKLCERTLGVSVHLNGAGALVDTSNGDPVATVIAAQAVAVSQELVELSGELEAAAIPLGTGPAKYLPDWMAAYEEVRALQAKAIEKATETEELEAKVNRLTEERDRQAARVKELTGERDNKAAELQKLTSERDQKTAEAKKLTEERDKLKDEQQRLKETEEENELLLSQLHQVQEELESYYLEAKELREQQGIASSEEMEALIGYVLRLEHEFRKLLKSRTWKAMAPIRELGRILKSLLRGRRVPRNRLPQRPELLAHEPVGGRKGRRTRV